MNDARYLSDCVGKQAFKTKAAALATQGRIAKRSKRPGSKEYGPMQAYRCDHCRAFHLGRPKR
jgi:hypothetical protein